MEDNDAQLQQKKRARRRLVGAVAFVSVVAVVLPMVMDREPRPPVQDVEIRIPGQDEKPFAPQLAATPQKAPDKASEKAPESLPEKGSEKAPEKAPAPPPATDGLAPKPAAAVPTARVVEVERGGSSTGEPAKPSAKAAEKLPAPEKPKLAEKPAAKPAAAEQEAKRAAAILAGRPTGSAAAAEQYQILIGAFANEANVRHLTAKLREQGIPSFTETLNSPKGKKTRLRAGPFPSRDAADKALKKMQRIGVSGVVAARQ